MKSRPTSDPGEFGRQKRRFDRLVEGHEVRIWVFKEAGDYSYTWSCRDLCDCFAIGRTIFDRENEALKFAAHQATIAIRAHLKSPSSKS
jgi:hypothetical protein